MAETVNAILDRTIDYAFATHPEMFGGFDRTAVQQSFATALAAVFPEEVSLSTTSPDFESVIFQLTTELSKDPVWYDNITAATGQTLIRWISAGIAYSQFSIERALQEAFGHLASSDSSIYAAAEWVGVRVQRVIPATVTVRLTRIDRPTLVELPEFTAFNIGTVPFFNRNKIIFQVDQMTVDVQLTQGEVLYSKFTATGQPYQELEIGDSTHDLSDTDVFVWVGGERWERSDQNPWLFNQNELKFLDATTPTGNLNIVFGNNIFGKSPDIGQTIDVIWVRSRGEIAHNAQSGLDVTYNGPSIDDDITGITLSNVGSARDMIGSAYYARMAPHMRAAGQNAVRRQDYRRWATDYPGIKDAMFRGQAELGPHKRSLMNVIGATVLTDNPMNSGEWDAFISYIQERGIFQCEYVRMDPAIIYTDVVADVWCSPKSSLTNIKAELEAKVRDLFKLRLGWLGWEVYKSDIIDILEGTGELGSRVEYVNLITPVNNVLLPNKAAYIKLNTVTLNMKYSTRDNFAGRLDINQV